MLKYSAKANISAGTSKLGQKMYRVPGLGLQERLIIWGGCNGAVAAMLLLGMAGYFAYDLIVSTHFFYNITLSPLRQQLEIAAVACGVLMALPLLMCNRKWRDLAVFVQGDVPLREAQERMGRLDKAGLEESLNDVARDFLRSHAAEVEGWRDDIKTYLETTVIGNPQLSVRFNLNPETLETLLENRVLIARAMLSGAPLLMQLGQLIRFSGHVYTRRPPHGV